MSLPYWIKPIDQCLYCRGEAELKTVEVTEWKEQEVVETWYECSQGRECYFHRKHGKPNRIGYRHTGKKSVQVYLKLKEKEKEENEKTPEQVPVADPGTGTGD